MGTAQLGRSGLSVSRICLGMMAFGDPKWREWVLPGKAAEEFVSMAAESGVNFFDTADMYSTGVGEEVTGSVLRGVFTHREDYVLATKVYFPMGPGPNRRGLSRKHIIAALDASLSRLGVDYIDLYQIHRWDDDTPIEETMATLHECVSKGKIRYLGASSMACWQFAVAQHAAELHGWTPFISMQPHYNLLHREVEEELLPYCDYQGVGVLPWSPLARGRLARPWSEARRTTRGKSDEFADRYYSTKPRRIVDAVGEIADERGMTRAQVALAWLLSKEVVTAPIIGATKTYQLAEAIEATECPLSESEVAQLEFAGRSRSEEGPA